MSNSRGYGQRLAILRNEPKLTCSDAWAQQPLPMDRGGEGAPVLENDFATRRTQIVAPAIWCMRIQSAFESAGQTYLPGLIAPVRTTKHAAGRTNPVED